VTLQDISPKAVQASWGLRFVWPSSCDVVERAASEGFLVWFCPSSYHNRIKADSKRGLLSEPPASCYARREAAQRKGRTRGVRRISYYSLKCARIKNTTCSFPHHIDDVVTCASVLTKQLLPMCDSRKLLFQHACTEVSSIVFWYSQTPKLKVVVYKNPATKPVPCPLRRR
jgi:hypothetical protein